MSAEPHSSFYLTFRAQCMDEDCNWDSAELGTQDELMDAVRSHHDMEVHTVDKLHQLLADQPTEPT